MIEFPSLTLAIMPGASLNKTRDTEGPNHSIAKHEAEPGDVSTALQLLDHTDGAVNADGRADTEGLRG